MWILSKFQGVWSLGVEGKNTLLGAFGYIRGKFDPRYQNQKNYEVTFYLLIEMKKMVYTFFIVLLRL